MIGTKNLNQMTINNIFITASIFCVLAYFISDFFFSDGVFYLIGGLMGVIAKGIGLKSFFLLIWTLILGVVILGAFKTQNKNLLIGLALIMWFLFYVIDAYLYNLMPDITTKTYRYLHMVISILTKSLLLSFVLYRNLKIT